MKFSWSKLLFYTIVLFGIVGLIKLLATNPMVLFVRILVGAAVIGIIIFLYKVFTGQKKGDEASAYKRAVRQSKKRHRDHGPRASHLQVIQSRALGKKRPLDHFKRSNHHHLTVIDGKKKRRKKLFFN